ncbi:MAG: hypothetical protein ACI94Y_002059, partial [Maribacter sp.]
SSCPKNIRPQHGNIMVQLSYAGYCMDSQHNKFGCADYAGHLLP